MTRALAHRLLPEDRLDCVEINERFVEALREVVAREERFAPHRDRIEILLGGVESLAGEGVYDLIVSGLPLNNFSPFQVRSIFRTFRRLARPGSVLTYFEYAFVRNLKAPFVGRNEFRRLKHVTRILDRYIRRHQVRRDHVFPNIPPAVVRQLILKPSAPLAEA